MEKLPFDYFNNNKKVFCFGDVGECPVSDGFEENIRRAIADIHNSHIALGYALIAYAESHTFGYRFGGNYRDCSSECFFNKCDSLFNLDRSSVSRHVNVVYRFGDANNGLRSSYRDKSFSYLCELLPLSESDIDHCLIHCRTVAEVRKYKAKISGANFSNKSVATSQQKKITNTISNPVDVFNDTPVNIPLSSSANEYIDYDIFRGKSLRQILDAYLFFQRRYTELLNSTLEATTAPQTDIMTDSVQL